MERIRVSRYGSPINTHPTRTNTHYVKVLKSHEMLRQSVATRRKGKAM